MMMTKGVFMSLFGDSFLTKIPNSMFLLNKLLSLNGDSCGLKGFGAAIFLISLIG